MGACGCGVVGCGCSVGWRVSDVQLCGSDAVRCVGCCCRVGGFGKK